MTPKITPVEIEKREFAVTRRGFDPEAVRSFLRAVAEDLQDILRSDAERESRLSRLEEENQEHRERERILKETLLTAQRVAEDIKTNAKKEAELIVRQAGLDSEHVTADALARAAEMERAVKELKLQRANFRVNFQATLEMFENLLALDKAEDDGMPTLSYLTPPKDGAHGA